MKASLILFDHCDVSAVQAKDYNFALLLLHSMSTNCHTFNDSKVLPFIHDFIDIPVIAGQGAVSVWYYQGVFVMHRIGHVVIEFNVLNKCPIYVVHEHVVVEEYEELVFEDLVK